MSFRDYLESKALLLCMAGIGGLYLALIFYLCALPVSLLLILCFSGVFVLLVCLVSCWRRTNRRLQLLKDQLEALPEKYLIGEILERPTDAVELQYYLLMKEISRSAIGAVEQARADNLTESILTYAKLRTAEKDTQISLVPLRAACDQAVREEMELLIAAGISVSIQGDGRGFTDPKLLVFILKQLLINCAKYCPGCQIQMELSEDGLILEDNGPGIPVHELRRVTERGFTGAAGRSQGRSTGMGLYIVSQLCQKLNIRMEISSQEGSFTRFAFQFPAPTLQNC